jgi:hypothetical protein
MISPIYVHMIRVRVTMCVCVCVCVVDCLLSCLLSFVNYVPFSSHFFFVCSCFRMYLCVYWFLFLLSDNVHNIGHIEQEENAEKETKRTIKI